MSIKILWTACVAAIVAGCAQTAQGPDQSSSYNAAVLGYEAYKSGDLAKAETKFETALSQEPNNAYALLGLGAVRENTGDLASAQELYQAAQTAGSAAPANFTYITEQNLERSAKLSVAELAGENLDRLSIKQASLGKTDTTGFASYNGETAVIDDTAVVPTSYSANVDATDGSYQNVGSYDSYITSIGGDASIAATSYSSDADIAPATYGTSEPLLGPTTDVNVTPYYDAPISYEAPVEEVPAYQTLPPITQGGPAGNLLQYGQAFGDPVDLVPSVAKDAYYAGAPAADGNGGLIYLSE